MRRDAVRIFAELEFDIDLQALTVSLSRARQQMVEFAKPYHGDLSVLILDEPTAPLTDLKVGQLFDFIDRFKVDRVGIIYISHRMQECARIANRIPHAARRRQDRNCEYGRHRQHRSGRDDDRPQNLG